MEQQQARIVIRPWRRYDDEVADAWPSYNDPLEAVWNLPRQTNSFSFNWTAGFELSGMRRTWAVDDQQGRLIGRISLRDIDQQQGVARLGITFGAPYVSKGLGTEAMALFLDHYFDQLNFNAMVLDVAAPNERAVRCYYKLGFQVIGDDWRSAGIFFDARIIEQPAYRHLKEYFRPGQHGIWVQFFEMRLEREQWQHYRTQLREHQHTK
jgi:RimJ/RimL family protein N-acetyltransferase